MKGNRTPCKGSKAEGEATQKHNKEADEQQQQQKLHREAAADGYAAVEKADAAGYAAPQELAKADELEPTQITKTNPFATPAAAPKEETPAVAAQQLTPNPENIPTASSPTPAKRKKNTREDDKDDDDEMDEDQGDPTTLAPEVQLRKIHQTLRKFSDRMANNEDSIEGQGRMIDEVAAKQRQEELERISKTYEILGLPEKANATDYLNWLISDPGAANIPRHEVDGIASHFSKPKDGKKNFTIIFRATGSKNKMDAYMTKTNRPQILGRERFLERHKDHGKMD